MASPQAWPKVTQICLTRGHDLNTCTLFSSPGSYSCKVPQARSLTMSRHLYSTLTLAKHLRHPQAFGSRGFHGPCWTRDDTDKRRVWGAGLRGTALRDSRRLAVTAALQKLTWFCPPQTWLFSLYLKKPVSPAASHHSDFPTCFLFGAPGLITLLNP